MLSVPICGISGKYLSSHGFHRFSQIWLHVIRVHLWHQWEMSFPPTDFTDFHRFGYMLSVPICGISGKCSFLPRISQIFTDLVTCYPCSFVSSVGIFSLPRISRIFTDLVTCYPCSFVASVGNVLFSHGFHRFPQIWLHVIRAHLWHQWEISFSHGFSQICTDLIINYPWVLCLWVK